MKQDLNTEIEPEIWDYTDPVRYLRTVYEYEKSRSPNFSYGTWAERMGLKSRSFLRLVLIQKRNLTLETAELFSKSLNHSALEKQYFMNLVKLSRATTFEERQAPTLEINKLRQKFALRTHNILEVQKKDLYDFLSSYKIPRLQILLTLEQIERTEKNLSLIMKSKESEVLNMLQTLARLGLAKKMENGEWHAQESKLSTPDVLGNVALQSFHKKSLEEAVSAIDLPPETRRYQSLVIALTPEQFQEVNDEIREHLQMILKRVDTKNMENKRIYQINLNLIPVTGSILRESEDRALVEKSPDQNEVQDENN